MAERTGKCGKRFRLRTPSEFSAVYANRKSLRCDSLVVSVRRNGLGHPRIGLSVSRRVGGAVTRTRVKRLLREVFRRNRDLVPGDFDLVFIPKSAEGLTEHATVCAAFCTLMKKLKRRAGPS